LTDFDRLVKLEKVSIWIIGMKNGIVKSILSIVFFLFLVSHWNQKGTEAIQGNNKLKNWHDGTKGLCENDATIVNCSQGFYRSK
jgi:hypothetical protein